MPLTDIVTIDVRSTLFAVAITFSTNIKSPFATFIVVEKQVIFPLNFIVINSRQIPSFVLIGLRSEVIQGFHCCDQFERRVVFGVDEVPFDKDLKITKYMLNFTLVCCKRVHFENEFTVHHVLLKIQI